MFGKVIDGLLTLRMIENVATGPNNRPKLAVKITGEFFSFSSHPYFVSNVLGSGIKQTRLMVIATRWFSLSGVFA